MTSEPNPDNETEASSNAEEASPETTPETPAPAESEAERIAALEAQVAELGDKWKRAMAEQVNIQQRAERARQEMQKYGAANFAKEMLGVADNLRRALDSVKEETRAANDALAGLWTGIEMTEREMLNAFERQGVKPIEAEGQRLNPHLHEAMMEMENPEVPGGTVLHTVQRGWALHDRLLRPAKVVVAKGGPKDATPEPAPDTEQPKQEKASAYDKQAGQHHRKAKGAKLDESL